MRYHSKSKNAGERDEKAYVYNLHCCEGIIVVLPLQLDKVSGDKVIEDISFKTVAECSKISFRPSIWLTEPIMNVLM